jgi:small-conductance mechanosensitive channel
VAFVIRVGHGGQSAERRAKDATKALKDAFESASPEDVHVEILSEKDGRVTEPTAVVYVGKAPIVQLTADDAKAAGDATLAVHADSVAAQISKAISAEKARSTLASHVFSISLVVFFGVVTLYLLRKVGEFAERANAWVEANPDRIPAIRVSRMEVLNPATLRSGLALTLSVGKWLGQFGIVYAWLIAALSLFESTRGYTERLTGFIVEPFASLASRIASSLPILLVIAIALLAVAILLRVVGLFFEGVATNKTTLDWLAPDLAAPTSLLVRGGIILATLVFAAPLITGNEDGALPRAGMVTMVAFGLAAVPFLASCILGAVAVFGRRVRVGEYIDLDGRVGRVADLSLLNISIEDDFGVETRIPHFAWLMRPMRLLGPAPRVTVELTVGRREATHAVRLAILEAIGDLGADPRVDFESLGERGATLSVSVVTDDLDAKSQLFVAALDALAPGREGPAAPEPDER